MNEEEEREGGIGGWVKEEEWEGEREGVKPVEEEWASVGGA